MSQTLRAGHPPAEVLHACLCAEGAPRQEARVVEVEREDSEEGRCVSIGGIWFIAVAGTSLMAMLR